MRFGMTGLEGAWLIDQEPARDERGAFARTFCVREFAAHGLETNFVQHSMSTSTRRHTLRGMHFQREPHAEVKLVSCVRGAIYDVIVDLRPQSPTRLKWQGFELTEANRTQLYIPKGFAHGFLTLEPDTVVSYLISEFYAPEAASGVRFDDPLLAIDWPAQPAVVSEKDRNWPLL
jgi:dTDP-4-dehydrorhamnose 3,5-epimerase